MSVAAAVRLVGGLGKPSKMPGHAYGLSALDCKVGGRLREVPGSTCSGCYAMRGQYQFPGVKAAHQRRRASLRDPGWVDAMALLINRWEGAESTSKHATGTFRWHDSGDLEDVWHLELIARVARLTPTVKHWIPTREVRIVRDWLAGGGVRPANLNIRISVHMIDHAPRRAPLGMPYSTVSTDLPMAGAHRCPAPAHGNECRDCRACWDPRVEHVDYHAH